MIAYVLHPFIFLCYAFTFSHMCTYYFRISRISVNLHYLFFQIIANMLTSYIFVFFIRLSKILNSQLSQVFIHTCTLVIICYNFVSSICECQSCISYISVRSLTGGIVCGVAADVWEKKATSSERGLMYALKAPSGDYSSYCAVRFSSCI